MIKKTPIAAVVAATASLMLFAAGCTATSGEKPATPPAKPDYTKMSPVELAEYMVFQSGSYDLAQPTQEGKTGKDRLVQDEIQKICSEVARSGKEIDDKTAERINKMAMATIKYPEGGIKLGDWKRGREIAWSGFGFRTAHRPDDHSKGQPGGNCYNCHQLATDRTGGNLGPSLTGYGKIRGSSPEMLKYTYEVIYNAQAYFACTNMPRIGANGVLSQQQILDVMAYLFDPASPVNK
ncbi:MAG: sulfur oxidation c-type cytochrome SoxX [Thiobacillaceae bacterium]